MKWITMKPHQIFRTFQNQRLLWVSFEENLRIDPTRDIHRLRFSKKLTTKGFGLFFARSKTSSPCACFMRPRGATSGTTAWRVHEREYRKNRRHLLEISFNRNTKWLAQWFSEFREQRCVMCVGPFYVQRPNFAAQGWTYTKAFRAGRSWEIQRKIFENMSAA